MSKIVAHARNTRSRPSAKCIWSADHSINAVESVRVELRQKGERAIVDIRRWRTLPDGTTRPTGKGVALAARHLPALKGLIEIAIAQMETEGFLEGCRDAPTDNWQPVGEAARQLVDKLDPRRAA